MSCCYSPVEEKRQAREMAASEWKDTMVGGWAGGHDDSRSMGRSTESSATLSVGLSLLRGLG